MDVLQRMGPMVLPRTAVTPLQLCAPATTAHAADLRRRFRGWVDQIADAETADDLSLAVYEALANVVDHAYEGHAVPGTMRLAALVSCPLATGRDLVVTVSDEGVWRPSTGPGWRGRGLPLMRELMHATSVMPASGGTIVQLRRRVSRREPALV